MRVLVGLVTVVVLCFLGSATDYQSVSLYVIYATLPAVIVFLLAYIPERPWSNWFGSSLLLLALGVLAVCTAGLLFRIYGLDYPFREALGMTWIGLMYVSMVMRTWVLLAVQWEDQMGLGGFLRAIFKKENTNG